MYPASVTHWLWVTSGVRGITSLAYAGGAASICSCEGCSSKPLSSNPYRSWVLGALAQSRDFVQGTNSICYNLGVMKNPFVFTSKCTQFTDTFQRKDRCSIHLRCLLSASDQSNCTMQGNGENIKNWSLFLLLKQFC